MVALVLVAGVAVAAYWPFPRAVTPSVLVASIQINRTSGPHPLSVEVAANVSGGTPPYAYNWSFGDGANGTTAGATHVYMSLGTYQVSLRVSDHDGRAASTGLTVKVQPVHEQSAVVDASAQTLGAGSANAWTFPVSIPSTTVSAWVNGSWNVSTCSLGGNCLAFVEVLNVHDETNLTHGQPVNNPIWCLIVHESCQAAQTGHFAVSLSRFAGQTVYLVLYNTDLLWSQQLTALASSECWY